MSLSEGLSASPSPEKVPMVLDPQKIPTELKVREIFERATLSEGDLRELMEYMGISESVSKPLMMAWEWSFGNVPKQGIMAEALGKVLAFLYEFRFELANIRREQQPLIVFFKHYKKTESGRMMNPNAVMDQMKENSARLAAATAEMAPPKKDDPSKPDHGSSTRPPSGSFRIPEKRNLSSDTQHGQAGHTVQELQDFISAQAASASSSGHIEHLDGHLLTPEASVGLEGETKQKPEVRSLPPVDPITTGQTLSTLDAAIDQLRQSTGGSRLTLGDVSIDPSQVPNFDE